jgi:hypothetical protein
MDFFDLNYKNEFDAVWACASLLHVPFDDLNLVIRKILNSLKSEGFIFTSFKYGTFEGEKNGRYFTYLTEDRLKELIHDFPELKIIELQVSDDYRVGHENEKWLSSILKKRVAIT